MARKGRGGCGARFRSLPLHSPRDACHDRAPRLRRCGQTKSRQSASSTRPTALASPPPLAPHRPHSQLSIYRRGRARHAARAYAARPAAWPLRHHRPPSRPRAIHHAALPFAPSDADCTHATRAARTAPPPLPLPPRMSMARASRRPTAARGAGLFASPPFPSSHRYSSRAGPLSRAASARTGRQGAATATAGPCAGA